MGKIGDLWVKLGLKKDEFERGLNTAKKGVSGFGSSFAKIGKTAAGAFGMIAGAAVAMGQQLIASTNKFGDAWARTMSGAKNSWQSFLTAISSGDTKGLWGRIKGAFGAGQQEAAARDQLFETGKAVELARAQIQGDLDSLYLDIFNTALTPQQRQAAIKKYQALLAPIYEAEKATTKAVMDATINSWLAAGGVSGVNQAQVIDFFKKLGIDPEGAKSNPLYSAYNNMGDGINGKVFDAITAYLTAQAGLQNEMRRLNKQSNMLDIKIDEENQVLAHAHELIPSVTNDFKVLAETMSSPELNLGDGWSEWLEKMEANGKAAVRQMEAIAQAGDMLDNALQTGLINGLDELANAFAGIDGSNAGSVVKALLSPLADAAVSAGMLILTAGEGVEAFKKAFSSLNGAAAIAAGGSLIAIGVAAKAGLASIGKGASAASSSAGYSTSTSSSPRVESQELTVYVKGTISGSDIALSYDRQKAKWNR